MSKLINTLLIFAFSYFGSFSNEAVEYVDGKESFSKFLVDANLGGVCGAVLGLITMNQFPDNYISHILASIIGGLLGNRLMPKFLVYANRILQINENE